MALRIFVSHSSQEDKAVLDAIAKAIKEHETPEGKKTFSLLMDTALLQAGDPWRARINLWLGACDAAVLVLSEKALESPWVVYEASVLSYRNRGGKFLIIPVLLRDPEGKLLSDRRLDAQQIKEVQTTINDAPAAIAKKVIDRLVVEAKQCDRPIDALVKRFRTLLEHVPSQLIDDAAAELSLELPWEPDQDRIRPLVERLVGSDIPQAAAALFHLGTHFRKDPEKVFELINLVAAAWINPRAISQIPEIAQAASGRAVALNAALQKTGLMYLLAASGGSKKWHFVPCGGDFAEASPQMPLATEICAMVEKELRAYFQFPNGDLDAQLSIYSMVHKIFVIIPAVGFTPEVITELQTKFKTVTFFFLTGMQPAPTAAVEQKLVSPIAPELIRDEETRLHANLQILEINAGQAQSWGTRSS